MEKLRVLVDSVATALGDGLVVGSRVKKQAIAEFLKPPASK